MKHELINGKLLTDNCNHHYYEENGICPTCHIDYTEEIDDLKYNLETLRKIIYAAEEYDEADSQAHWEAPHPIFQLAQENDNFVDQIGILLGRLISLTFEWDTRIHEPGPDDYGDACQDCAEDLRTLLTELGYKFKGVPE
jgi:hypothetical protein